KLPACKFSGVQTGHKVLEQIVLTELLFPTGFLEFDGPRAQHFETIVVHCNTDGAGFILGNAVRHKGPESFVHKPSFERININIMPFGSASGFDEHFIGCWNSGPFALHFENWLHHFHLGPDVAAFASLVQFVTDGSAKLAGNWHPAPAPAW